MPLINPSTYSPPPWLRWGHFQTVYPTLFRKVAPLAYMRERLELLDGDFLDLDWVKTGSKNLVIISHGLEGDSSRAYVQGIVQAFNQNSWDALAWNFRSCSEEMNRLPRLYHSGSSDDLDQVIQHVLDRFDYEKIALVGFSMGGNISLKYLGEKGVTVDSRIKKAVVFSVPCDLEASAEQLRKWQNRIYMKRFLRTLHKKIRIKKQQWPELIQDDKFHLIKNFHDYDEIYTAPMHGFRNAKDYWQRCSSIHFIPNIKIPTLIVNAKNDSFLSGGCYPYEQARCSKNVYLEVPDSGGHVGFCSALNAPIYWSELKCLKFVLEP